MTKKFQEELRALLTLMDIDDEFDIQVKPFFGGAAAYTNGRIFLSLTKVGFAVKLSTDERQVLLQVDGAKKLQYFPKAPIKKEYVVLPDDIVEDTSILRQWVMNSLAYVTSISGKKDS